MKIFFFQFITLVPDFSVPGPNFKNRLSEDNCISMSFNLLRPLESRLMPLESWLRPPEAWLRPPEAWLRPMEAWLRPLEAWLRSLEASLRGETNKWTDGRKSIRKLSLYYMCCGKGGL